MDEKNPKLVYETSTRNLIIGGLLFGIPVVPVVTAAKYLWCPVGVKQ